ncbi:MAG TPA: hypothetical protein VF275_05280 [Gammaproteobacteria bacterium]
MRDALLFVAWPFNRVNSDENRAGGVGIFFPAGMSANVTSGQ